MKHKNIYKIFVSFICFYFLFAKFKTENALRIVSKNQFTSLGSFS